MPLGPFDLSGGPFLILYSGLLLLALTAAIGLPFWLRPEGRERRVTDPDQLAYLAGGRTRFLDALVTRLLTAGRLAVSPSRKLSAQGQGGGHSPAETAILRLPGEFGWAEIERTASDYADPVERALARDGLLMDAGEALRLRFWQTLPLLAALLFGAIKWDIGTMRDKPVGILTFLLLLTLVAAVIRFFALDRRTQAGIKALDRAQADSGRLRRAPLTEEMGLAVALYGTAVLAGSTWSDYHALRRASGSDGGGSSDSGSGDGGGGCGGCGGGD
ncbi:MAG: TIGR04222 domain-containing membrane protein [Sphingobium sp.]|uniref:TIGR04222 domain-containing membrane protein n=1 Tax=Sphingobium sp. TaxID=1912891 RepID=UPI002E226360